MQGGNGQKMQLAELLLQTVTASRESCGKRMLGCLRRQRPTQSAQVTKTCIGQQMPVAAGRQSMGEQHPELPLKVLMTGSSRRRKREHVAAGTLCRVAPAFLSPSTATCGDPSPPSLCNSRPPLTMRRL